MKKIITAAIGGVVAAGLIVLASPNASAGPDDRVDAGDLALTQDEMSWGDEHGKSEVCDVFGANPTTDGMMQVVLHIMDEGWEQLAAARIMGYSVAVHCPEHLNVLVGASEGLPG